jgi:ABC-type Mn2+/Zn2+ transport system ATPase subunit/DNA-binding transcriptional regulator YhcF (GntR family)
MKLFGLVCIRRRPKAPDVLLLAIAVLPDIVHRMIPFHVDFKPGAAIYKQVVYAATKSIISGQLRPGDEFPSVRVLSRELKINPNTAHKVVTRLADAGLLEIRPGSVAVVAKRLSATKAERTNLLEHQLEELVVEGKRLGVDLQAMQDAIAKHWSRLSLKGEGRLHPPRGRTRRMTAIRTEGLTKMYHRHAALDCVNLEVQEGAIYALVGQNGAGKTTAIKILMNLITATRGSSELLGTDSRKIRGKFYGQVGYVSENQEVPEWMKVGAFLEYLQEFYPTWDTALERSLVKQFELPVDEKIKSLSRGMKMKLALAGALSFHPRLIILDEPFGGLDPLVREQLIEGLLERAAESTVFLSFTI